MFAIKCWSTRNVLQTWGTGAWKRAVHTGRRLHGDRDIPTRARATWPCEAAGGTAQLPRGVSCAGTYTALQAGEVGSRLKLGPNQTRTDPQKHAARRERTRFPGEQRQELCCSPPSSPWSQDAAHALRALRGAGWHLRILQHRAALLPWPETPPQEPQQYFSSV